MSKKYAHIQSKIKMGRSASNSGLKRPASATKKEEENKLQPKVQSRPQSGVLKSPSINNLKFEAKKTEAKKIPPRLPKTVSKQKLNMSKKSQQTQIQPDKLNSDIADLTTDDKEHKADEPINIRSKAFFQKSHNITPSYQQIDNLRSKLQQWKLSNIQLDQSFQIQKETALYDIKDRFLQIYDMNKQNYELQKVLENITKMEVIEQMVNVLSARGVSDLQWQKFNDNLGYISQRTDSEINKLEITDSKLMVEDIFRMEDNLRVMLDKHYNQSQQKNQMPLIQQKLAQLMDLLVEEEKELDNASKRVKEEKLENYSQANLSIQNIIQRRQQSVQNEADENYFLLV